MKLMQIEKKSETQIAKFNDLKKLCAAEKCRLQQINRAPNKVCGEKNGYATRASHAPGKMPISQSAGVFLFQGQGWRRGCHK